MNIIDLPIPFHAYRQMADILVAENQNKAAIELLEGVAHKFEKRPALYLNLAKIHRKESENKDNELFLNAIISCFQSADKLPKWVNEHLLKMGFVKHFDVLLDLNHLTISKNMRTKISQGNYEKSEVNILNQTISSTDKILEVGAGIGFIGLYSKLKFPKVSVLSFEANPELIPVIKHNQKINNTTFEIRNEILSQKSGKTKFHVADDFWASSSEVKYNNAKTIEVDQVAVQKVLNDYNPNFLVVDIEGGEKDLMPIINFDNIEKILIELHPQIIGEDEVNKIINIFAKNQLFEVTEIRHHGVYFFQKKK